MRYLSLHPLRYYSKSLSTNNKIRILKSTSLDPFVNLATEDWIFNELDPTQQVLYLWRNDKTVVIGKHQNPWKECHVNKMEQDGIFLARRRSGGGAVYQDMGNTIFTFLSPKEQYDKFINFEILKQALHSSYQIPTELSGRNDMIESVQKRKISGSAFKVGKDRAFHHGTLLLDVNMNALSNYLNPHKLKLASKGVASVTARVVNLKELNPSITHEGVCESIMEQFKMQYQSNCEIEEIKLETLQHDASWKKYYDELRDWNWRFGQTPQFSHNLETRFDQLGLFDVYFQVEKNIIKDCKIFSDTLYPILVELIQKQMIGAPYSKQGIEQVAVQVKQMLQQDAQLENKDLLGQHVDQIMNWLAQNL